MKRTAGTDHNEGLLFVFEGPDGVGKTSVSKRVAALLTGARVNCNWYSFPGRDERTLGRHVYDIHHSRHFPVGPDALQTLHVAAHVQSIESNILPALAAGRLVILDRYWWSTWAYGLSTGGSENYLRALIEAERVAWRNVKPSIVFFMRDTIGTQMERKHPLSSVLDEYDRLALREQVRYAVETVQPGQTEAETADGITKRIRAFHEGTLPMPHRRKVIQPALPFVIRAVPTVAPYGFAKLSPAKPTHVYDTYWRFAAERQAIFFRRLSAARQPWTQDAILREYKFTNVYRASDRVSQFLIRNVAYRGELSARETFFRVMLFKLFNKVATWELLSETFGELRYADFSVKEFDRVLTKASASGARIYSAAYIMPTGGKNYEGGRKHKMHLELLERMMREDLPSRLEETPSMGKAFELLRAYPTIGDFLGYQFVTDLNYTGFLDYSEMEFVIPGPGAKDGIRKCFSDLGGLSEAEIIKLVTDRQEAEFERLGVQFPSLWGRRLQLIDCQNVFCEVDKYSRVRHPDMAGLSGRTRIKQKFAPTGPAESVWYPPKWGLNEKIAMGVPNVQGV